MSSIIEQDQISTLVGSTVTGNEEYFTYTPAPSYPSVRSSLESFSSADLPSVHSEVSSEYSTVLSTIASIDLQSSVSTRFAHQMVKQSEEEENQFNYPIDLSTKPHCQASSFRLLNNEQNTDNNSEEADLIDFSLNKDNGYPQNLSAAHRQLRNCSLSPISISTDATLPATLPLRNGCHNGSIHTKSQVLNRRHRLRRQNAMPDYFEQSSLSDGEYSESCIGEASRLNRSFVSEDSLPGTASLFGSVDERLSVNCYDQLSACIASGCSENEPLDEQQKSSTHLHVHNLISHPVSKSIINNRCKYHPSQPHGKEIDRINSDKCFALNVYEDTDVCSAVPQNPLSEDQEGSLSTLVVNDDVLMEESRSFQNDDSTHRDYTTGSSTSTQSSIINGISFLSSGDSSKDDALLSFSIANAFTRRLDETQLHCPTPRTNASSPSPDPMLPQTPVNDDFLPIKSYLDDNLTPTLSGDTSGESARDEEIMKELTALAFSQSAKASVVPTCNANNVLHSNEQLNIPEIPDSVPDSICSSPKIKKRVRFNSELAIRSFRPSPSPPSQQNSFIESDKNRYRKAFNYPNSSLNKPTIQTPRSIIHANALSRRPETSSPVQIRQTRSSQLRADYIQQQSLAAKDRNRKRPLNSPKQTGRIKRSRSTAFNI